MTAPYSFDIAQYDFNSSIREELLSKREASDLWPLVYILSNGDKKQAYVGETADVLSRLDTHQKHEKKQKLTTVHLISSSFFNKSATLDIESNLIQYMAADGQFELMNGNLGIANHTYYQKQAYWSVFTSIWDNLQGAGLAKHSLDHIDNSDLFKYSPYKSLSREQSAGLVKILRSLAFDDGRNIVIQGGAGTGKTILAVFLFKLLNSSLQDLNFKEFGEQETEIGELVDLIKSQYGDLSMGLVVPMSSFRKTLQNIFSGVGGLSPNMVIGPADVANRRYDLLIVDEAHRLRQRVNLGAYFRSFDKASEKLGLDKMKHTELDWVLQQSDRALFFYDTDQSIKPSDVSAAAFESLKSNPTTKIHSLQSQFRAQGGNDYVAFIDGLLQKQLPDDHPKFLHKNYELKLFDSLADMVARIQDKNEDHGLSRLIAGYSWPWLSKSPKNKKYQPYDIEEDGLRLRWNSTNIDWINTPDSIEEVGCIHTTQGYDLNFTGIIFGNEVGFDPETQEIVVRAEHYHDRNGKATIKCPERLKSYILNIYKTILLRGIRGTYIYVCDPALREYMSRYIPLATSEAPIEKTIHPLPAHQVVPFENSVPLYSMQAAAGGFGLVEVVEKEDWITVPIRYALDSDCFACRVVGESMNRVIPNGSVCLFRRYKGGSRSGKIFLVELNAFTDAEAGSAYTVKEYRSEKVRNDENWQHRRISLYPRSHDPSFLPLELTEESASEMRVIGEFIAVLGQ
ncbi:hypothetical protein GGR26_003064 [Lewinella marina]|uniref:GIY-YIG domain-containing protein n=1 Tax=Neolewinella marina TaxID=438751 RepID=A0A2G0CEI1_9BACT|nr:DNA/RNA helicase domain-containing protein [Neolewinella marina]NJB87284.1 hypothetical protein [Neolewinella marina]PHK98391.1 hypothetical protein CGL56_11905 [Neolewinella marina]